MVEKFASNGQQWEVIRAGIHEEFDGHGVDAEGEGLQERDESVDQLLIVEVELEGDEFVEEWVRENVVFQ